MELPYNKRVLFLVFSQCCEWGIEKGWGKCVVFGGCKRGWWRGPQYPNPFYEKQRKRSSTPVEPARAEAWLSHVLVALSFV